MVGERGQGTLEPLLTTPIRREELLLVKALAAFVPTLAVAYALYVSFLACTTLFAQPAVASPVLQGPNLLAQVLFMPLIALLSIWIGIGSSACTSDVRVAQQLGALMGLPALLVAYLITFDVIPAMLGLALSVAALLLVAQWWNAAGRWGMPGRPGPTRDLTTAGMRHRIPANLASSSWVSRSTCYNNRGSQKAPRCR